MDIELGVYGIALIPLITALVEVAKRMGMPARFAPIPALVLGIAGGVLYVAPDDIRAGVLVGLVMGLGAIGVYETVDQSVDAMRAPQS